MPKRFVTIVDRILALTLVLQESSLDRDLYVTDFAQTGNSADGVLYPVPTSFGYVSSREPKTADMASAFENDFSYTGTQDMGNVLSIPDGMCSLPCQLLFANN